MYKFVDPKLEFIPTCFFLRLLYYFTSSYLPQWKIISQKFLFLFLKFPLSRVGMEFISRRDGICSIYIFPLSFFLPCNTNPLIISFYTCLRPFDDSEREREREKRRKLFHTFDTCTRNNSWSRYSCHIRLLST